MRSTKEMLEIVATVKSVQKRRSLVLADAPMCANYGLLLENNDLRLRNLKVDEASLALACVSPEKMGAVVKGEKRKKPRAAARRYLHIDGHCDTEPFATLLEVSNRIVTLAQQQESLGYLDGSPADFEGPFVQKAQDLFVRFGTQKVAVELAKLRVFVPEKKFHHVVDTFCTAWLLNPHEDGESLWKEFWLELWVESNFQPPSVSSSLYTFWKNPRPNWAPDRGLGSAAALTYLWLELPPQKAHEAATWSLPIKTIYEWWLRGRVSARYPSTSMLLTHVKPVRWLTEDTVYSIVDTFRQHGQSCAAEILHGLPAAKLEKIAHHMNTMGYDCLDIEEIFQFHDATDCNCVPLLAEMFQEAWVLKGLPLKMGLQWLDSLDEQSRVQVFSRMPQAQVDTDLFFSLADSDFRCVLAKEMPGLGKVALGSEGTFTSQWVRSWVAERLDHDLTAMAVAEKLMSSQHLTLVEVVGATSASL